MTARVLETVHCLHDLVGARLCRQTLKDRIAEADTIKIISAYYDVDFIASLLDGKKPLAGKDITFVFNRNSAPHRRHHLVEFRNLLIGKSSRSSSVRVCVANAGRFLHSKVYQFRRGKWKRTLVGSANATANGFGRNDELLLEVAGRHNGLEAYVDYIVRTSLDCQQVSADNRYHDFEEMLRDGYIYFEPKRVLSFSIDCFSDRPALQSALEKTIGGEPLPYHDGANVGSLNILKLVGINDATEETAAATIGRKTPYVIETALGYWAPTPLTPEIDKLIAAKSSVKERQLLAKGVALARATPLLATGVSTYLEDVTRRLATVSLRLSTDDRNQLREKVERRFARIRDALGTTDGCKRYARTLEGTPMPELWEDPYSAEVVKETFCDYVSEQLKTHSKPHVVKQLAKKFYLRPGESGDDIREKIERAFQQGTVSPAFWVA